MAWGVGDRGFLNTGTPLLKGNLANHTTGTENDEIGTSKRGEVIIDRDALPLAVTRPAEPLRHSTSECIALMPAHPHGGPSIPDFAEDEAAVAAERTGRNARQSLEADDESIATSEVTVVELAPV